MPEQTFPVDSDDVLLVDASQYPVDVVVGVSGAATVTDVPATGSGNNSHLLAVNTSRKGAIVFNYSPAVLYVKLGSPGSTTDYSMTIEPQGSWTLPVFTGDVWGIWAGGSPTGGAKVTELS